MVLIYVYASCFTTHSSIWISVIMLQVHFFNKKLQTWIKKECVYLSLGKSLVESTGWSIASSLFIDTLLGSADSMWIQLKHNWFYHITLMFLIIFYLFIWIFMNFFWEKYMKVHKGKKVLQTSTSNTFTFKHLWKTFVASPFWITGCWNKKLFFVFVNVPLL